MTRDEVYQSYDGIIPDDLRQTILHGSYDYYMRAFVKTSEQNFSKRFSEILQSLCVWRGTKHYPVELQFKMLEMLSCALFQAREAALVAWMIFSEDLLHSTSSASAVIAPPINTA